MIVQQFVNSLFSSNTYLLKDELSDDSWVIDVGDVDSLLNKHLNIKGVFLTHSHFDHIYGINELISHFPQCHIYVSEFSKDGLYSEKLNMSSYHGFPYIYHGNNIEILSDKDQIEIFSNVKLEVIATPGHNPGCLTFRVGQYLFTGDSFIPGVKVVTILRGGNKLDAKKSVGIIESMITENSIICAGHGRILATRDISTLKVK